MQNIARLITYDTIHGACPETQVYNLSGFSVVLPISMVTNLDNSLSLHPI